MNCPECGHKNNETSTFCVICGSQLIKANVFRADDYKSDVKKDKASPTGVVFPGTAVKEKPKERETVQGGRYILLEKLGEGGMGRIYLSKDTKMDSLVVIKELLPIFITHSEREYLEKRFQEEAKILFRLDYRGLPKVIDFFCEEEKMYIIMQYIEGQNLQQLVKEREVQRITIDECLEWMSSLLDIVDYLHSQDPPIIHRDIKPKNVMLNNRSEIFLVDFGLARTLSSMTRTKTSVGTYGYSSPEHYSGKFELSSDIFSLGATFHHLLSGDNPQHRDTFEYPPLKEYIDDFPDGLQRIFDRMLSIRKSARFPTVKELRQALTEFREEKEKISSPGSEAKPSKNTGNILTLAIDEEETEQEPSDNDDGASNMVTLGFDEEESKEILARGNIKEEDENGEVITLAIEGEPVSKESPVPEAEKNPSSLETPELVKKEPGTPVIEKPVKIEKEAEIKTLKVEEIQAKEEPAEVKKETPPAAKAKPVKDEKLPIGMIFLILVVIGGLIAVAVLGTKKLFSGKAKSSPTVTPISSPVAEPSPTVESPSQAPSITETPTKIPEETPSETPVFPKIEISPEIKPETSSIPTVEPTETPDTPVVLPSKTEIPTPVITEKPVEKPLVPEKAIFVISPDCGAEAVILYDKKGKEKGFSIKDLSRKNIGKKMLSVPVLPGMYSMKFLRVGYYSILKKNVHLEPGKEYTIAKNDLKWLSYPSLTVKTNKEAKVTVVDLTNKKVIIKERRTMKNKDGSYLVTQQRMKAGSYRVVAKRSGYKNKGVKVFLKKGEAKNISLTLKPKSVYRPVPKYTRKPVYRPWKPRKPRDPVSGK